MEKHILSKLVDEGKSQRKIADELGFSQSTIKYWLKRFGIKTKRSKSLKKFYSCCRCGEKDISKFYGRSRSWCINCHNEYSIKRGRKRKAEAVVYKGGKCEICGYNKCFGSMDFHHKDPKQKDSRYYSMRNWSLEKFKPELDKCMLVCKNCHGEMHWNLNINF